MAKPSISVIYLARVAEGISAVERFVKSYNEFPAGIEHDLVIYIKGGNKYEQGVLNDIFESIATRVLFVDDTGFDIHVYLESAKSIDTKWVCFLNTFSILNCSGWLERLYMAVTKPGVGLAGATASFESRSSTLSAWIWYLTKLIDEDFLLQRTHDQFSYMIKAIDHGYRVPWWGRLGRSMRLWGAVEAPYRRRHYRLWRAAFLKEPLTRRFPNPHVRSNGFIVQREYLTARFPSLELSKTACFEFESGYTGLSASIIKEGLSMLLVSAEGDFRIDQWPDSRTFRSGKQEGLVIKDNQTQAFENMTSEVQDFHRYATWGDSAIDLARFEFPNFFPVRN